MNRKAEIAKARKVDTQLAELWEQFWVVETQMRQIAKSIEDKAKWASKSYNQNERYQAEAAKYIADQEAKLDELRPTREEKRQAAIDFDETNYEGWNRFFLVQHIHSNRYCSSFRPTTRVGWLPDVSGLTEAEAVAEHGATLCTICFPSAPTELTTPKVDESICTGTTFDRNQPYELRRMAKYGTCTECGTRQTLTSTGKVRKHKKP